MDSTLNQNTQWQLKPHVHLVNTSPNQAMISWLGQRILLKSSGAEKLPQVFKLLQTPRTLADLVDSLSPGWSPETIKSLLLGLSQNKLVFSNDHRDSVADKEFSDSSSPWWPYFNLLSCSVPEWRSGIEKIETLQVTLLTRMKLPNDLLKTFRPQQASPETLSIFDDAKKKIFVLVLSSTDIQTMHELSHKALTSGALLLPVLLDLSGAVIGPLLGQPGQPCLKCLSKRLQSSGVKKIELQIELPKDRLDDVEQAWPFTSWMKLDAILQDEIFKLVSELTYSPLHRGAYLLDFFNQRNDYDEVFPIPGCECSCGVLNEF